MYTCTFRAKLSHDAGREIDDRRNLLGVMKRKGGFKNSASGTDAFGRYDYSSQILIKIAMLDEVVSGGLG